MKYIFAVLIWFSFISQAFSQSPLVEYNLETARTVNPDSVFYLTLEKEKLTFVPSEIYDYKNLRVLNLSKNKINKLTDSIKLFTKLEKIDLTKNDLDYFPIQFCDMQSLTKIAIARNNIAVIPECIKYIVHLQILDLWDNPIRQLPESLVELKELRVLDLRNILFNVTFQTRWGALLPDVKIYFDPPCNCLD